MAKQKRKPAKSKPISSHQLFPAVVALWFGALFGLGSLAVRPSLLEGLVLNSHLDLIVPAAAPPLGVTARILVALIMAATGAILGVIVARQFARPKHVVVERKRQSRDLGREQDAPQPHYADASTRPPVPPRDDDISELYSGGVLANRRRALAIEHDEEDFVPHDFAPLPGGHPQVFDISQLGIGAVEAASELARIASTHPVVQAEASGPVNLDWSNTEAPMVAAAPIVTPDVIEAQRQLFQAEVPTVEPTVAAICPATAAAQADGRQVFGVTPPAPPSDNERQIFGVAVVDGHVPHEFVRTAGFKTTVFGQERAEPLFAGRETASAAGLVSAAAPASFPQAYEPAPATQPQAFEPVAPLHTATRAHDAEGPLPSPASLGMIDLATRLAESMRRRSAARAASAKPAPAMPAATDVPAAKPRTAAATTFEPLPAGIPAAPALPRAMQPLALDAFIEEDALPDPSLLPPRHIAMPVTPAADAAPEAASVPAPLELGADEELAEDASYASLLEVSPARNPFVRIDEPEAATAEIEPVVIFPGQAPMQPAPSSAAPQAAPFRRFDAPVTAGQGVQVAASAIAPTVDPGEADRALRAALSNLQRMSGAA